MRNERRRQLSHCLRSAEVAQGSRNVLEIEGEDHCGYQDASHTEHFMIRRYILIDTLGWGGWDKTLKGIIAR